MEQIYLTTLIIAGIITFLYILLEDILALEIESPWLNPTLVVSFVTFSSAACYIIEKIFSLSDILVIAIGLSIGFLFAFLMNIFFIVPMKTAEVSLVYTEESLGGQIGKVITPIPVDGYGEIVIETVNGMISKSAVGYENQAIDYGKQVLIIEVSKGVAKVKEYEPMKFK